LTAEAYAKALAEDPLIYTPGTGGIYSNFAYDALGAALAATANKPYADLLKERAIDPAGFEDTIVTLRDGDRARLMQGHNFDGSAMPDVPLAPIAAGAGAMFSTTNDMLKWLDWHMRQPATEDAETLLLNHAANVYRDSLSPAYGFDESGHMDAMGLGWIVMMPEGDRPLLLQKARGLQGTFVYTAFAPAQNIGVFVAINEFDFAAAMGMAKVVNELIATLAPR
jgi:D-alanyl-D-alanine-carboxypeptidase/D-alanyl-D-alanine-endopeptidase